MVFCLPGNRSVVLKGLYGKEKILENTATVTTEPVYSKKRVVVMIAAILFCTLAHGFGNFKLIPMQQPIMDFFGIAEGAYGFINTASHYVSIFCAIPIGYIVRKLPCKWTAPLGLCICICGMMTQVLTTNFVVFVIGRVIEGGGMLITTLVSTSFSQNLVPRSRIAIWSSLLIFLGVVPQIVITKTGIALMSTGIKFQVIFAAIAGLYCISAIVWLLCIPKHARVYGRASSQKPTREQTMRIYKNPSNWFIAIAGIMTNAVTTVFASYILKYWVSKGLTQTEAADLYTIFTFVGMASMIGVGLLSDKLKTKRKLAIPAFIQACIALIVLTFLPANLLWVYILLYCTLPRGITGLNSASAVDIAEVPSDMPIVNSFKNTVTQIGSVAFGLAFGFIIQNFGYDVGVYVIAGCMAVGAICWTLAKRVK